MLRIENLEKHLGDFSLEIISFDVARGDYFVLMGRSGSGKTQLLELLAGLSFPDSGKIYLDNRDITRLRPQDREIGMVFQDYALFPHMTARDNIAYPLKIRGWSHKETDDKINEIAGEMNILRILHRSVRVLSGGELQRTALARTLVLSPRLLLLDEPLASIDSSLKDDVVSMLRAINRAGQTIIHVTHDYSEAIAMASRVGVINNGMIVQTGTPSEVFNHPVNGFVARYTGIRNTYKAVFFRDGNKWKCKTEKGLILDIEGGDYPGRGMVAVRNNNVKLSLPGSGITGVNTFRGRVTDIITTPSGLDIEIHAGERIFASVIYGSELIPELHDGTEVIVTLLPADIVCLGVRGTDDWQSDLN